VLIKSSTNVCTVFLLFPYFLFYSLGAPKKSLNRLFVYIFLFIKLCIHKATDNSTELLTLIHFSLGSVVTYWTMSLVSVLFPLPIVYTVILFVLCFVLIILFMILFFFLSRFLARIYIYSICGSRNSSSTPAVGTIHFKFYMFKHLYALCLGWCFPS